MKEGRSLSELAAELERQAASKKDYLVDTRRLNMKPVEGGLQLDGINGGLKLRGTAHAQLSDTLRIPKPYYDRMLAEAPDLLAVNVNRWFAQQPAKKLVRTLDGEVRAVLSDSYRPLDNFDLAHAVLPKLKEVGASVESAEVTESRFYLKAITGRIQSSAGPLPEGITVRDLVKYGVHQRPSEDIFWPGVMVSNSEIGDGALRIEALDFRLVCWNGAVSMTAVRKAHLGRGSRGQDAIEEAREFFRDETRLADDRAFWLKVQDSTAAMFDQGKFEGRIAKYRATREDAVAGDVEEVVEVTANRFGLNEAERKGFLSHLIQGHELSRYGVMNAITRMAQDVESYDRSTELEAVGARVIELPRHEWDSLARAGLKS